MGLRLILAISFFMTGMLCLGQNYVKGLVLDCKNNKPVENVNIIEVSNGEGTISDANGMFQFKVVTGDTLFLQLSCVGYRVTSTKIIAKTNSLIKLCIDPQVLTIDEVSVIAEEKQGLETASVIKKDALRHLQPTSFADVLELLPGAVSKDNDMTKMKMISLREPIKASSFSNLEYDNNSSFGTSFVIDGQPLSNDAELQNVTGSYRSEYQISKRNTTGKGIDMRLISTDNIESIEVIRGIPSVKYGELTSGVIDIKRNYKKIPLYGRIKSTPGSKLFSIGKGIALDKNKSLNANIDYLDYRTDPRNPKVNYSRITGSLRYQTQSITDKSSRRVNVNLDYTGSFDETIADPEIDLPETDKYKNTYNKINFGTTLFWKPSTSFVESIRAIASGSFTHDKKKINKSVSTGRDVVTTNRDEGEFYGEYLPTSYLAEFMVDGKPFFAYAEVSANLGFIVFKLKHSFLIGGDFRYDKNFGEGEVYDETRPLYPGVGRPVASKDIPSNQKLSFYAEDQINIPLSSHLVKIRVGLRATKALNIDNQYAISGKFFLDPRLNLIWRFPYLNIFRKTDFIEITGGYGLHTKFPALTHLYPNLIYSDLVQLNYYSQNENLRQVQYKTKIIDPTNFKLSPNRNQKFEIGFNLKLGQVRAYVTAYHELLKQGFKQLGRYQIFDYKLYNNDSVDPSDLTEPPTIDMFDYVDYTEFVNYNKRVNGAREEKIGLEYQIDLGKIEAIKSRLTINGAWMNAKYDLSDANYDHPNITIDDKDYPYIGYYTWDKGKEYEQFNTNFRADTHIKKLGLIFSTAIQCMWYYQYKYNPHDGMPDYYLDQAGNKYVYKPEDTTDSILRFLYDKPDPDEFDVDRTPIGIDVNLTVSKIISKHIELSFYVNRILDYHPDYTTNNGNKITRKVSPYFGMELNINL